MNSSGSVRVLFVCLGNICRSPLAEGMMKTLLQENPKKHIICDSAGTSSTHQGEQPDPRTLKNALQNGIYLDHLARPLTEADYALFDHLLCMDSDILREVMRRKPKDSRCEISLFRTYDPLGGIDVPDPYYGGSEGFQHVFDIVKRTCQHMLSHPHFNPL